MDRLQIVQTLMKQKKLSNYLEIGVFNGHIFFKVKSNFKIAVDPEFRFDGLRKAGKVLINPYNLFNRYYEKTSDAFFGEDAPGLLENKKIDISLIDGMHEYAFALRDVENTLRYMSQDAVIIMHDCNPQTKQSSISFAEWKANNFEGVWNGDVWKAIVHLRSLRNDINVFVLDCDHGLGIITRKNPEHKLAFSQEEIARLRYEDLDKNRKPWLNLKPESYFYQYFGLQ
jgi:hypothetical protein